MYIYIYKYYTYVCMYIYILYSTSFNPQTNHQTTGVACHCSYEIAFAKILCQHLGRGTSVKKNRRSHLNQNRCLLKICFQKSADDFPSSKILETKSAENLHFFHRSLKKGRRVMVKSSICIPFFKRRPSLS